MKLSNVLDALRRLGGWAMYAVLAFAVVVAVLGWFVR